MLTQHRHAAASKDPTAPYSPAEEAAITILQRIGKQPEQRASTGKSHRPSSVSNLISASRRLSSSKLSDPKLSDPGLSDPRLTDPRLSDPRVPVVGADRRDSEQLQSGSTGPPPQSRKASRARSLKEMLSERMKESANT